MRDREDRAGQGGGVGVVIPAAGSGTRMGGERKQHRMLGDAPVLVHTVRAFLQHPEVSCVVVVGPEGERRAMEKLLLDSYGLETCRVAEGGASRQISVGRGLACLPQTIDYVLVHDAVRPFVTASLITAVIEKTREHGAAVPAIPVADTVRRATSGIFGETVPRDGLFLVQTPQGFRRDWLVAAHEQAAPGHAVTDDAALVQQAGHTVHLVDGLPRNFKITTPDDWALARAWWVSPRSP